MAAKSHGQQADERPTGENTARPPMPKRQNFERQLSQLNEEIAKLETEKWDLCGSEENVGIKGVKGQILEKKKEKEVHRKLSRDMEPELNAVKLSLEEVKKQMRKVETDQDWMMKDESRLTGRLNQMQDDFKKRNLTLREESRFVKEIDKLGRAIRLAKSHSELTEKRKKIDAKYREISDSQKKAQTTYRKSGFRERGLRGELEKLKSRIGRVTSTLRGLHRERSGLIRQYDSERKAYEAWNKERRIRAQNRNRQKSGSRSGRPKFGRKVSNANRVLDGDSDSDSGDEEELEPFYREKSLCKALLDYLSQLRNQVDKDLLQEKASLQGNEILLDPMEHQKLDKGSSTESESGIAAAMKQGKSETNLGLSILGSPKAKKRTSRRRKLTHKINHDVQKMGLFEDLKLVIPATFQDIPASISSVVDLQKFYEGQTEIPTVESPLEDDPLINFAYPSSGSEMTADSALTTSMSVTSLSLTQPDEDSMGIGEMPHSHSAGFLGLMPLSPPERLNGKEIAEKLEQIQDAKEAETGTTGDLLDALLDRPPLSSTPTLTASGQSFEIPRSFSDSGGTTIQSSTERSDGAQNAKAPSSVLDEINYSSHRLIRVPTSDEGIAGIGEQSKESSVNSTAQAPDVQALRRQFQNQSVSDSAATDEEVLDLPRISSCEENDADADDVEVTQL